MTLKSSRWSSPLKHWFSRCQILSPNHGGSLDFEMNDKSSQKFIVALLVDAPADPDAFAIALFEPDIAVDAFGRILRAEKNDIHYLMQLYNSDCR